MHRATPAVPSRACSTGEGVASLRVLRHGADRSLRRIDLPDGLRLSLKGRVARVAAALRELGISTEDTGNPNSKIRTWKIPYCDLHVVPFGPRGPYAEAHGAARAMFDDERPVRAAQDAALLAALRAVAPLGANLVGVPYQHELALNADTVGRYFRPSDRRRFVCRSRTAPYPVGACDALTLYVSRLLKVYGKSGMARGDPSQDYLRAAWTRAGWRRSRESVWRPELTYSEVDFLRLGTTNRNELWRRGLRENRLIVVPEGRSPDDENRHRFDPDALWELLLALDFPEPGADAGTPPALPRPPQLPEGSLKVTAATASAMLARADVARQAIERVRSATPEEVVEFLRRQRPDFDADFAARRRVFEARYGSVGPEEPRGAAT